MKKITLLLSVLALLVFTGAMCETESTNTNENTNEKVNTAVEVINVNEEIIEPETDTEATDTVTEEETAWLEYEANGYTFAYPDYYTIEITRDEMLDELGWRKIIAEIKQGDEKVGQLDCPIVETGYEIWTDWVTKERSYEKDGLAHGATLKTAQPMPDSGAKSLAQIYMHRKNFASWGDTTDDFVNSCQILFNDYEDKIDIIEHIYNSVY